jgi:acyl-CoA dehydrogenase
MPMNCQPIATLDERINDIRMRTAEIVNSDILPNERRLWRAAKDESWSNHAETLELRAEIKEKVKQAGLWAPHLPTEYGAWGSTFWPTPT